MQVAAPLLALALPTLLFAQGSTQAPNTSAATVAAKGEVLEFTLSESKVFPGTTRQFWIYIPAAYNPEHPACLYVHQDGVQTTHRTFSTNSSLPTRCPSPSAFSFNRDALKP